ncbi:RNA polymerase sigma factor [Clostridium sp. CF012]|uniref:RNA polymerase sigma factor n=1 Tax=Clostridium sp. CF012 TaxID=2843319 RepID=UPI001C0CE807|nr:RNA polymerase sigma factor [Clostridium sp. CF012]MBU3144534.1 RNA polymerase sigma factor [Clostridium sp. CF012]
MNDDVITQLYISQMSIIYKYLVKLGCSKQEAEDIVQESFTRAMEHMDGVRLEKLRSWLFTVAINVFRTFKKRNNRLSFSLDEQQYCNNFYSDDEVETSILVVEKGTYIKQTLESLKKQYKTLLLMKYQADLSYKQISILLGIPENTVKTYLYRAREEFKERWRENYERR